MYLQGFVDDRHGDVLVVRPMRDYTAKEIAFYNHFFHVPTVIAPPLRTKVGTSPVPCGGILSSLSPRQGRDPPILPLLAPPAPGEAQHPPPDRAVPPGAAGGLSRHHQHRLPVWHPLHRETPGWWGGWGQVGCTCSPAQTRCRTGEKLSPAPAKASSESERCLLCLCALDIAGGEWGTRGLWGAATHPQ